MLYYLQEYPLSNRDAAKILSCHESLDSALAEFYYVRSKNASELLTNPRYIRDVWVLNIVDEHGEIYGE